MRFFIFTFLLLCLTSGSNAMRFDPCIGKNSLYDALTLAPAAGFCLQHVYERPEILAKLPFPVVGKYVQVVQMVSSTAFVLFRYTNSLLMQRNLKPGENVYKDGSTIGKRGDLPKLFHEEILKEQVFYTLMEVIALLGIHTLALWHNRTLTSRMHWAAVGQQLVLTKTWSLIPLMLIYRRTLT